jgi:hypothetical protein
VDKKESNVDQHVKASFWLGALICMGLIAMAAIAGYSALTFKGYERFVSVKGLSEKEVAADVAVWPIRFSAADNDLTTLYASTEKNTARIVEYLRSKGFEASELTVAAPAVVDKLAQQYGNASNVGLRYMVVQSITVRSAKVDLVRTSMKSIGELGKTGIVFGGAEYQQQPEFFFTKLNALKPAMVEEATRSAREVASKFANDSNSKLGKIRSASQGQFSVESLDNSMPHVKKVRVVSTVEYYLSD